MRIKITFVVLVAATTGALAACSSAEQAPQDTGRHHYSPPTVSAKSSGPVDKDEAGRIATDKYRGTVLNAEPDQAKGKPTWEIEIKDSTKGRIEVDVSQQEGRILEMESDNDRS